MLSIKSLEQQIHLENCRDFLSRFKLEMGYSSARRLAIENTLQYTTPNLNRFKYDRPSVSTTNLEEVEIDRKNFERSYCTRSVICGGDRAALQDINDLVSFHMNYQADHPAMKEILIFAIRKYEDNCRCGLLILLTALLISLGPIMGGGYLLFSSYDEKTGFVGPLYFLVNGIVTKIDFLTCTGSGEGGGGGERRFRRLYSVSCNRMYLGYNGQLTPSHYPGIGSQSNITNYEFNGTMCSGWFDPSDYNYIQVGQPISFGVKYSSKSDCSLLSTMEPKFAGGVVCLCVGFVILAYFLRLYVLWKYGK